MRLGAVLVALVGINVYVFFFNRGTAPREILNMQSTSKTFESTRQEALAADVRKAGELVASSSGARPAAKPDQVPSPREAGRGSGRGAAPTPTPTPAPPGFKIPFAPPPEPVALRAPPAPPAIKIPFAPPPDSEADADTQAGVEKTFAANDTLGQVMAREGFGSAGANVIAALTRLVDPRSIRGGQKYIVRAGDDGTPEAFEYQPTPALGPHPVRPCMRRLQRGHRISPVSR